MEDHIQELLNRYQYSEEVKEAYRQTGELKRRWKNYYRENQPVTLVDNENQDQPETVNVSKD